MTEHAPDALDKPVQFFTGKGGVGKSTVISAVALRAAKQGRRPLIVELGAHTSTAHMSGGEPVGYDPVETLEGVHATRVLFEPALVDYIASRLKLRPIARAVAKNASLRRLFVAAPGVDEIVTMHRVADLATESSWGPVLIDLESTGNALMFFDLPQVLDSFLEDGPLRQVVDRATRLLRDPERCVVHVVSVPEPLVVRETIDLYRGLLERQGVNLGRLFINRVPPLWLDPQERDQIERALAAVDREHDLHGRLRLIQWVANRRDIAQRCIDGLRHDIPLPTTELAMSHRGVGGIIGELAHALDVEVSP
ncbi:MAG: ArsA family ATPase [Myxococcota bacterium]